MEEKELTSVRPRLLSHESLCFSESEYQNLVSELSPRHKNSDQIAISIDVHTKTDHVIYKISGQDADGVFQAFRRYKDFLALREILAFQWPGCIVPKLPSKKKIVRYIQGNLSDKFVNKRKRLLGNFLRKTVVIVHFYNSLPFSYFIKNSGNFQPYAKNLKQLTNLDLYVNYKENFPIEQNFEYSDQTRIYILQTIHYLKNSLEMIFQMKKIVKKNIEKFHCMKSYLCRLLKGIKELSFVFNKNTEIQFNVKKKRVHMFQILLDWSRSEILDIEAMIEGITKVLDFSDNFSVKNDHSLKNLLEETLESNQLRVKIVEMVQQRLVLYEIPKFRESKGLKWEMVFRTFQKMTKSELGNLQDILLEIDKNFNV